MKKTFKAVIALVLATFLYSFFGVLTRLINTDFPIFFASFVRNLISVSILLLPFYLSKRFKKIKKTDYFWLILRSIGGTLGFLGSFYAFYNLPIGIAYFIFYGGSTIAGFILGVVIFKEKIDFLEGFSLSLALIGLYLICSIEDLSGSFLYVLWALIGGVGGAVWNVFSKKISGHYNDIQVNGLDFFFSGMIMFLLSLFTKEVWQTPSLNSSWLATLLFVLMFIFTGQLMIYGFKHLDAQKGSLIMLMEVVFGAIIGVVFFQEIPSPGSIVGGFMVLAAAALPSLRLILTKNAN